MLARVFAADGAGVAAVGPKPGREVPQITDPDIVEKQATLLIDDADPAATGDHVRPLGKVFSAFMTGNVVFLAAGLFAHQSELALHAAIALCAFGAGAWATAWVMPRQNPGVLWPARVTTALIACALLQLVFWVLWLAVGGHPGSTLLLLLAILAFAMGIQTAAAVILGVHAVFTTAVTATWTVLVGDAAHWSETRTERRRLTLVLAGTLLGALAGALLLAHLRLWMPLLPVLLTSGVAVAAR